jgi:hypothetical protein
MANTLPNLGSVMLLTNLPVSFGSFSPAVKHWILQIFNNEVHVLQFTLRGLFNKSLIFDYWCFNATFSNISAFSWQPVLVVEEAGASREHHFL